MVATHKRRESMSAAERQEEDVEMMQLTQAFNALMESTDPMQR